MLLTKVFQGLKHMGCSAAPPDLLFFPSRFSVQREPQTLNAGPDVCVSARFGEHMLCLSAYCDHVCLDLCRYVNMYV